MTAIKQADEVAQEIDINKLPIFPAGWRVLVLPVDPDTVSEGGIILADTTKDANKHLNYVGKVISVGELAFKGDRFKLGDRDAKAWCEVGDYVLYGQYAGQTLTYTKDDGETIDLLLLNDDEVKATTTDHKRVRAYV